MGLEGVRAALISLRNYMLTNALESEMQDCDLSLQLQSLSLRIPLLSPSSIQASDNENTPSRLLNFYHSWSNSHCQKYAIAFFFSENSFNSASGRCDLDGLLALQALYET